MEQKTEHPNPTRPAFPTNARMYDAAQGLTKREYFAIKALSALIQSSETAKELRFHPDHFRANAVYNAMLFADELLNQLSK